MSSAILYVAIVAIWACVLIPRWLRRDSSVPSSSAQERATDEMATAPEAATGPEVARAEDAPEVARAEDAPEAGEEQAPRARRRRFRRDDRRAAAEERRPVPDETLRVPVPSRRVPASDRRVPASDRRVPAPGEGRKGAALGKGRGRSDDLAHRRVLSARRRLLAMLVVLTIAAGALAGTKLAAWWVILPPVVMLFGYLILLRAAGKADAERREWTSRAAAESSGSTSEMPTPRAEIIEISASRNPRVHAGHAGHAGHLSQASQRVRVREELYDQDEDAKLRAVGD